MIISLIIILLILAIIFISFNYKKTSLVFLTLAVVLLLLGGSGILPQLLLKKFQSYQLAPANQQWGKRNAIVLLGGGAVKIQLTRDAQPFVLAYSRIYQTACLYQSCKKSGNQCTLIISGGDALHTGVPEAVVYKEKLVNMGINQNDIILESRSLNTYQNAEFTSSILKSEHFDKVFLVTTGIHLKRALLYFAQFDIKSVPIASDYLAPLTSIIPLGYNIALTDSVLHEYAGILRLYVYNFLGWNKDYKRNI